METDIPVDSSGSLGLLSDEEISGDVLENDTWIEELECALLADCDPATLKKISEGKLIPASLRPDYWRTLLALNDAGKVKLTGEYDLPNQDEIRQDCERLVEDISNNLAPEPLSEADMLRLRSDFESTLTTYVKARPELYYVPDNGWTDILKVLYNLQLSDTQMYQMFFRIVDRYIPKDLSAPPTNAPHNKNEAVSSTNEEKNSRSTTPMKANDPKQKSEISSSKAIGQQQDNQRRVSEKSIQAYHLLRLLIQYHDPELCSILDSRKVTPNLYVKDWFCSLFARSCPPKLALYMWDVHFKMADPFLIFFAAIVMVVNASDELKKNNLNQAEMLNVLRAMPGKLEEDDIEDLYYLVSNHYTNSTPRSIRSYSHLFFMDTFGNTYMGNESPEDSPSLVDLRTTRLTSSIDLSQYLCLPIVPAEIFALDTAQQRSSPTHSSSSLRYFLVDCRPAEQYNAGHLKKAFHLDCSLMLREPSSFATAVQALLEIQRQVVASKSNTGGQHLCFIGSGQEEEDQYVNMVVASFLQKYQKYVSIVFGGFDSIHDYVKNKSELKDSFNNYIIDHNEELCKACCSKSPQGIERLRAQKAKTQTATGGLSSAQSLFATTTSFFKGDKGPLSANTLSKLASNPHAATTNMIAQSSASIFDKFTSAFVSKSNVIKERLVETLNTATSPTLSTSTSISTRSHVSSQDKLGPRYMGGSFRYGIDDLDDLSKNRSRMNGEDAIEGEPCQEVQIDVWKQETKVIALYKCAQIKGNIKYPGYIALTKTHLWILREIPHNKGFASIAAKRPIDMIVQITSKRRQPDFIIFRYGHANSPKNSTEGGHFSQDRLDSHQKDVEGVSKPSKSSPTIIASDHLHIPQAFDVIRLVKHEIVRIMDESSRENKQTNPGTVTGKKVDTTDKEDTKEDDNDPVASASAANDDRQQEKCAEKTEDQISSNGNNTEQ